MAWSGDHSQRPAEVFTVIHGSPAMHQEAALLGSYAMVAWLDRDLRASTQDIAVAIAFELGALTDDVSVVKHFPEAYLVRFFHQHHCIDATGRRDLPFRETRLQLRPWSMEAHSRSVDLVHHVRLCLDGLPLQAWDDHAVAQAIGPGCSIDYIEAASRLKMDCEVLAVWAWTASPANVPRVNWVTLPTRAGDEPAFGRRGRERRVIIHLSIHEDPTQGPRVVTKGYNFQKGVVNGERQARDPRGRISRPDNNHRRDRDDDQDRCREDRDRRGRDDSRNREGWAARIRRSLSRQPRDSSRDHGRGAGREERRGAAGRDRDGRRRAVVAAPHASAVLLGSGSSGADAARVMEMQPLLTLPLEAERGRSVARHPSPRAARRRSQESLTPPVSPPLSPTTVLPPSPRSMRNEGRSVALVPNMPSLALLELCSPQMLLLPVPSPSRPPGFEASPTPPLLSSGLLRRTPSPVRHRRVAVGAVGLQCLAPLFEDRQEAILPTPTPALTPPRAPAARRKTMASVTISRVGGALSLHKTRAASHPRATPVATAAEILVCRSLGIVKDGEDVTAATLDAFAERFKAHLSSEVIMAMRGLFKLDDANAHAVEEALLSRGGGGALDLERADEEAELQQAAT
ncbi:hypothetical protein VPH35_041132 [Triticum aestivum]